jgi:hypothetical protein
MSIHEVRKAPSGARVVLRALRHFSRARKVKLEWNTIIPFFRASTERSTFVFKSALDEERPRLGYVLLFKVKRRWVGEGELVVRKAYIDCPSDLARDIVEDLIKAFTEAIERGRAEAQTVLERLGVEVERA